MMLSPTVIPNVDGEREVALGLHAGVLVGARLCPRREAELAHDRLDRRAVEDQVAGGAHLPPISVRTSWKPERPFPSKISARSGPDDQLTAMPTAVTYLRLVPVTSAHVWG
jgi:hypothetical protein